MRAEVFRQIRRNVAEREGEMLALLERIVRMNSHSANHDGINAVAGVFATQLEALGFAVEVRTRHHSGNMVLGRSPARMAAGSRTPQVLLVGHMDTVFPVDAGFDCFRREGRNIIGPGIIDMKGGLVTALFALMALDDAGELGDMPVTFVLNPDEEIGSPWSRECIEEEARRSGCAFVFECSGLLGETVTGRKGRMPFTFSVSGPGGHSGATGLHKPSAIVELARRIVTVEGLNEPYRGLSVNVGVIEGGTGPNVVPEQASAYAEARYMEEADGDALRAALENAMLRPGIPGTVCRVEFGSGRPAMEPTRENRALFGVAGVMAARLGIPFGEDFRGGVSDANFIARAGCPVLDGMGPSGARDHSHDEYMVADSLVPRTQLAAMTMTECWRLLARGRLFDD